MPDPALEAALREAWASLPEGSVIRRTLELWHPALTAALRVVAGGPALAARLEAEAPRQAGEVVSFMPVAFNLRLPELVAEAPGVLEAEIDNTGRELLAELDATVVHPAPVEVIYRGFLHDRALEGPGEVLGGLELRSVSATPERLVARCGFPDLVNERFPRMVYSRAAFPTLEPGP